MAVTVLVMADAPGALLTIGAFVNTIDVEQGEDELSSPRALATWLREAGLLERGAPKPGQAELDEALRVREGLRALLLANNGAEVDRDAVAALDGAGGGLRVRFAADGTAALEPAEAGVRGALARLLAPIPAAMDDGTWARLKACPVDDCTWAFYDESRNRSRQWCAMQVCGNRAKARAYRARRRTAA